MTKVYPNAIRTFPAHKDGRDFVLAADVNEIQEELTGVETAVGAKPQIYTNASGKKIEYKDVATRLDSMQKYDDQVAGTVNKLIDASEAGWNLPVASMRGSGTSIPPTYNQLDVEPSDWYPVTFNIPVTDPLTMCKNGPTITCPRTGWWIVTMRVIAEIASGPSNIDHFLYARLWLDNHGTDMATGSSNQPRGGEHAFHRADLTYSGEWYQGERLQLQIRHMDSVRVAIRKNYPNPVPNIVVWGWTGLTYVRALPNSLSQRPVADLDPTYPV
ncbi:hypothetical protein ACFWAP_00555 [Streptomyces goshikiensis]|uniref:hypothetical protein n=1 Tax=Streptomyces goshikiensis TaxID=1942 RepID=UPI003655FE5C